MSSQTCSNIQVGLRAARPSSQLPPRLLCVLMLAALVLQGCASHYGNLADVNQLGAAGYQPSVLVLEGKEAEYAQLLSACRRAAFNRQVTASAKAQEGSMTSAVTGVTQGAAAGYQVSDVFKTAGLGGSRTQGLLAGAGLGLATGLASAFSGGTSDTSDATRSALLNCLRGEQQRVGFRLLE